MLLTATASAELGTLFAFRSQQTDSTLERRSNLLHLDDGHGTPR